MEAPVPEWPGAVSRKFGDAITGNLASRRVVETGCRNGVEHGLARNGFARYFTDTDGLNPTQGKRTFEARNGEVCDWRPSRRSLSEPGCGHYEKNEGRRVVEQPVRKIVPLREKRHIRQAASKEEFSDRPLGPRTVVRENGLRAVDQPAREVDISTEFARKGRVSDLVNQRNGFGCRALGDKSYRHPDYENNFHHVGGLIVGSTFMRGTFKKTESRSNSSVPLAVVDGDRRPAKSYEEAQRERQLFDAQAEVVALTREWEAGTLKECDAKYEELSDSEDEGGAVVEPEGC